MDVTDCSGIDLHHMEVVFGEILQELRGAHGKSPHPVAGLTNHVHFTSGSDLQRTLLAGQPHLSLMPYLQKTAEKVAGAHGINRARLFIKPGDLVDGMNHLSLSDQHLKEKQRDVITKGLLLHLPPGSVCIRCEGKSETNIADHKAKGGSVNWRIWERQWARKCICGGLWMKAA